VTKYNTAPAASGMLLLSMKSPPADRGPYVFE
jgi:hypothetical protein